MDGAVPDADVAPLAAAAPPQKRDEWSESGIVRLLEVYESKWLLRNRAKLKWSDWVDIAQEVSAFCSSESTAGKPGSNTPKTPNQCKNKIESMKKRYRAESAAVARAGAGAGAAPSWRFFPRMDELLKGPSGCGSGQAQPETLSNCIDLRAPAKAEMEVEADYFSQLPDAARQCVIPPELVNADHANGCFVQEKFDKVENSVHKESRAADSDFNVSSPRIIKEANDDAGEVDKVCDMSKKRKSTEFDIAKSIELLASSFLKIEQARMDMYRETERMRVEADIKKDEMELKRTEIMAKTQLQIAKLFAKRFKECCSNTGGSSSVKSEVDTLTKKGENGSG